MDILFANRKRCRPVGLLEQIVEPLDELLACKFDMIQKSIPTVLTQNWVLGSQFIESQPGTVLSTHFTNTPTYICNAAARLF